LGKQINHLQKTQVNFQINYYLSLMDNSSTQGKNGLMEHKFVSKLIVDIFNCYSTQKIDSGTYKYCKNVQHQLSKSKNVLETLQLVRLLVAEKHPSIALEGNDFIDRETILGYHLDNYFIRLNRYKPDIIQLIAAVNEWVIPDTTDEPDIVLHKAKKEGLTGIITLLENIDALLARANPVKSGITDKTGMSAADISLIESVKEAENLVKHAAGSADSYEEDKNEYYLTSVANNLKEMALIEGQLYINLVSVLDTLYSTYAGKVPDEME
jgi:hypothetical protein